ncbi:MFS transporter [Candidatus Woesearchaeota archaeon]|nr:MFS transporter [Candidatus Woesearchaeota archaeon]
MLNRKIKVLLYGSNLWYFGEGMLGPLFAVFTERVGGSILDIAWAWATYLLVTGLLVIVIGKVSDHKLSKEKLLVFGYVLNTLFTFGYLLVSSPVHLFIIQAGLGVAVALAAPTWNSLYAKYEDKKEAGYEWGLAIGESQIVMGVALVIGGLIVNYFSFKLLFITMGCIQVVATVYQALILRKK